MVPEDGRLPPEEEEICGGLKPPQLYAFREIVNEWLFSFLFRGVHKSESMIQHSLIRVAADFFIGLYKLSLHRLFDPRYGRR
jgi:hypothetical protein